MTLLGSLVIVAGILAGCGAASAQSQNNHPKLIGNVTTGNQLYQQNCVSCHSGGVDASKAYDAMKNGENGMQAFSQLTDQQQADIVAFIQTRK